MTLTSNELLCVAQRNLPLEENTACLPAELLNLYVSLGSALFTLVGDASIKGWFLLVPLSKAQVSAIESGSIQNGFAIAEQHLKHGLTLDVAGYYLMGIYGDKEARDELNKRWREFALSSTCPIYAKGTTDLGKRWMARSSFKSIELNPILQVLR